ncbi:NUDIX domain-containing protein [candidate division KSB1 bacterium]|nr:NUDIX domain-containing protein [candidate division KSB1 bacterium]
MLDDTKFQYCPRCGQSTLIKNDNQSLLCSSCHFLYYHSTAAAVVGIIEFENKLVLTRRAREPQKGLFSLPGGFVGYQESLEVALQRELKEELNLDVIEQPVYFSLHWGNYFFRDVLYYSVISYFLIKIDKIDDLQAGDDVESFQLVKPNEIDQETLAFEPDKVILERYCRFRSC